MQTHSRGEGGRVVHMHSLFNPIIINCIATFVWVLWSYSLQKQSCKSYILKFSCGRNSLTPYPLPLNYALQWHPCRFISCGIIMAWFTSETGE